jgi:hypothetical protein
VALRFSGGWKNRCIHHKKEGAKEKTTERGQALQWFTLTITLCIITA